MTSSFYAVAKGYVPGIYETWTEAEKQVKGYSGAKFKKFSTKNLAQDFMNNYGNKPPENHKKRAREETNDDSNGMPLKHAKLSEENVQVDDTNSLGTKINDQTIQTQWYYAVAKGRQTGIFTSWKEAKSHVTDCFSAKYKKFATEAEALSYIQEFQTSVKSITNDTPDPMDPTTLVAFCDGSVFNNGYKNCKAGYACIFPHYADWNVAKAIDSENQNGHAITNNRAEYLGALEALKRANMADPGGKKPLYIFTDSMLLLRSMTEWIEAWRKNGWRKATGELVKNQDLLVKLVEEKGTRHIIWKHVKAHTGKKDWQSKWNDVADQQARLAASTRLGLDIT